MGSDLNESELLAKCAEILGIESIGAHDDFFGVGGDSLDAAEVSEMLSEEFQREVQLDTVLRSATFGDMIKSIRG